MIASSVVVMAAAVSLAAVPGGAGAAADEATARPTARGSFIDPPTLAWLAHPIVSSAAGTEVYVVAGSPTCTDGWKGGAAGRYTFDVLNDEGDDIEIYLQDTTSKKIYLEVENFGINATRTIAGTIPPGTYQWVCITSYTIKSSAPISVTGQLPDGAAPIAGVVPVSPLDMRVPINQYTAWVQGRLPTLTGQVRALAADLRAGDAAAAKRDWLAAHLTYETLGAAYGAFGELDDAIDGDPHRGIPPAGDPGLAGFRKIEALLWAGRPPTSIATYADRLVIDIGGLHDELAKPNSIAPLDMGIRAHEILEDTLGKDLDGIGDAGSGTELATVDANITGTFEALQPLLPILEKQDPWLARTQAWLRDTQKLVRSFHRAGGWVPLQSLTVQQRADVDAHVQQAVELLSHIPPITEPRDNPDQEGGSAGGSTGGNGK